jgi:hypothetical protein
MCRSRENIPNENLGRGRRTANKQSETAEHLAELAELKRKQDALSAKKNDETYKRLTSKVDRLLYSPSACVKAASCCVMGCLIFHSHFQLPNICSLTSKGALHQYDLLRHDRQHMCQ